MGKCQTVGRIAIHHRNTHGVIGQITTILGNEDVNVSDMTNKSRGDYAYTLLDLDSPVSEEAIAKLSAIEAVIRVRVVK